MARVVEALHRPVPGRPFGLCVITGDSGMGKSQLAAAAGGHLGASRVWFDASLAQFNSSPIANAVTIVVDGASSCNAPRLERLYVRSNTIKHLAVTTSDRAVGEQVLRSLGCATECDERLIIVPALANEEIAAACEIFGTPHTHAALQALFAAGQKVSPAQLRILAAAEHHGWTRGQEPVESWGKLLLQALPQLVQTGLGLSAIGAMACASRTGVPLQHLAAMLSHSQLELIPELDYLLRQRLIRVVPTGSYDSDPVLRTHACLSAGVQWREKDVYIDAYRRVLLESDWDRRDFVCRLEQWCEEIERVFDHQVFRERDSTHRPLEQLVELSGKRLAALLPDSFPVDEALLVARCLGNSVVESRCDDVIALAAIGQAALGSGGNTVWADLLQEGWRHHDSWARGACILVACRHYATRAHLRPTALTALTAWWKDFRLPAFRQGVVEDLDIDIGAAYAGALALGGDAQLWTDTFAVQQQVCELLATANSVFMVPALALLDLAGKQRVSEVQRVLDIYWPRMLSCEGKDAVRTFLDQKLGQRVSFPGEVSYQRPNHDWSLPSLLDATSSEEFEAHAGPRTSSRFSVYSIVWTNKFESPK